jgi:hypothetical protein
MAIKFSTKQQTPPAGGKPAKAAVDVKKPSTAPEAADDTSVAATDLFKSQADASSRKTRKK